MGWVYAWRITIGDHSWIKVGKSQRPKVQTRLNEMLTPLPVDPVLVYSWQVRDAHAVEMRIHDLLTADRVRTENGRLTELFRSSDEQVRRAFEAASGRRVSDWAKFKADMRLLWRNAVLGLDAGLRVSGVLAWWVIGGWLAVRFLL